MTSHPKSLLTVSESYWPTIDGGALFEHRLSHALRLRGWQVHVWAPSQTARFRVQDDHGILIVRESSRRLRSNPRYRIANLPFLHTAAVFRLAKPHVVHIHNFGPLGLEALRYARLHKIPVVVTNHNMPQNWTANFFRRPTPTIDAALTTVFRNLLNSADIVVSPSQTADSYLSRTGIRAERRIISNGVDIRFFQPPSPDHRSLPNDSPLRLVHVGRLDYEKSCEVLIAAAAQVSLHRPTTLTIVGSGIAQQTLRRQVRRLELEGACREDAIKFAGCVSEQAKRRLFQAADLYVTASTFELQGIAVLEAMGCGISAIGPDAGALPELCRPGLTGMLFKPGQPADCARQLSAIDFQALHRLGARARQLVRTQHDAEITYDKYDRLLDRVGASRQVMNQ